MQQSDMLKAISWYMDSGANIDKAQYCPTRDVFEGRISQLAKTAQRGGVSTEESYLLTAVIGEIGLNSFDHNIGHWRFEPGINFGYKIEASELVLWIVDRGRGIYNSLSSVHKTISSSDEALDLAFHKKISGRFPENRGNGLKFVRQVINCEKQRGLWCRSMQSEISFGKLGESASKFGVSEKSETSCGGTITFIVWRTS